MSEIQNFGNKKVVAFIPARGGSNGIENKNLVNIGGQSLLSRGIMTLQQAGVFHSVWVSTQDEKIKAEADSQGANVIDRPEKFCGPLSPTEDAIGHFLGEVSCDVILVHQITSPMLTPASVREGVGKFMSGDYDSMFSAVKANDILIWQPSKFSNIIKPINYDPQNRGFRQTRDDFILIETGAFFIFTREIFEETWCRLGGMVGYSEVPFWQSFQIDDYTDLSCIKKLMAEYW